MKSKKNTGESSTEPVAVPTFEKRPKESFTLSSFEVMTTLGTGTFGRVRLVKNTSNGKFCALKILKKSEIIRLKQVDHIKSEVSLLSMIQHPFVVNLLGHFQDDRRLYMALEYVQGGELFSYLRREGSFSDADSKFYAGQITLAFQYLHTLKIVYRDLKPENLLITTTGNLKITDFGFAKLVEDRTWTLCGTPEYLAPEIIQSKGHGKSVDWWAMGILIYEMLAGFPPFFDENPFGIYQKILTGRIDFPKEFEKNSKSLIKGLLNADRTKRLGCLKNEAEDIKKHKWFAKVDWKAVFNCQINSPYIPPVISEDDTANFDPYPDSVDDTALLLTGKDRETFNDFDSM